MWEASGADGGVLALGRLGLCSLPGAAACAWAGCRLFGRRPLAMALLSLAMPMLLGAVWLAFGPQFEVRRSDALLLWSLISVAAPWAVAPEALPRTQRARQAVLQGVFSVVPTALLLAVHPTP